MAKENGLPDSDISRILDSHAVATVVVGGITYVVPRLSMWFPRLAIFRVYVHLNGTS